MRKQLLIIGMIILLVTVNLCGCNEKNDVDKIIGTWKGTITLSGNDLSIYETYIFLSNNTMKFSSSYGDSSNNSSGTWKIVNSKLNMTLAGQMIITDYHFTNDDKTLGITDSFGTPITLTKQ